MQATREEQVDPMATRTNVALLPRMPNKIFQSATNEDFFHWHLQAAPFKAAEVPPSQKSSARLGFVYPNRDADVRTQVDQERFHTYLFKPGMLGIMFQPDEGIVSEVAPDGQASQHGIRAGWRMVSVAGEPYFLERFEAFKSARDSYTVVFAEERAPVAKPDQMGSPLATTAASTSDRFFSTGGSLHFPKGHTVVASQVCPNGAWHVSGGRCAFDSLAPQGAPERVFLQDPEIRAQNAWKARHKARRGHEINFISSDAQIMK
jgi:hypothetical protein